MREHHKTSSETIADGASGSLASLVRRWGQAWNAHDMDALAYLVTDDVAFVTVAGKRLLGREEVRRHHQNIHQDQMRDSTWRTLGWESRHLPGGHVLVHVEWAIDGDRDPDQTLRARRFGVFTWLVETASDCRIRAAHNTDMRLGISHRTDDAVQAKLEIDGGRR